MCFGCIHNVGKRGGGGAFAVQKGVWVAMDGDLHQN